MKKPTYDDIISRYEAILNHAGYAMIVADVDGLITLFNPAAEAMLGYKANELIGKHTPAIFHDLDEIKARAEEFSSELNEYIKPGFDVFIAKTRHGLPNQQEWTYVHKDGHHFIVMLTITALYDHKKNITGYLGIASDITILRHTEQALQSAQSELDTAIEVSQIGVWSWNISDNQLVWNDRMYAMYELPLKLRHERVSYEQWRMRLHPDDAKRTEAALKEASQGLSEYNTVFRIVLPSNSVRYIHGAAKTECDRFGKIIQMTGMNLDVTAEHEYQDLLKTDREKSDAANIAKSNFLANMTHEIRTPMNAIIGLSALLKKTELNTSQRDYINRLESAGTSLLAILNDILDFSKIESHKLQLSIQPTNFPMLLHKIASILSVSLGDKTIEVLFNIDPNIPITIDADEIRLQQILLNLTGNALKFTSKGEVILSVTCLNIKARMVTLEFSVQDTGIGISKKYISNIFESFSQGESNITRRFGGTGLGLTISKQLIDLMGGKLCVESKLHVGSRFYFQANFHMPKSDGREKKTLDLHKLQSLKCLLVTENISAQTIIGDMLRSFGWQVEIVTCGKDAINLMSHTDKNIFFDVVYIDFHMSGMDGWETSQQIRALATTHNTYIIMMTTIASKNSLDAYQKEMPSIIDGLIIKPITPSTLFDVTSDIYFSKFSDVAKDSAIVSEAPRLLGKKILLVEDNRTNQIVAHDSLANEGALVTH